MMGNNKNTEPMVRRNPAAVRLNRSDWMEMVFAFAVAASSLFLLIRAHHYIDKVMLEPEEIPPIFFPRVVLLIIFALSSLVIVRIVFGKSWETVDLSWPGAQRMLVTLAALLIYVLIFKPVGFILSTALLVLFLSWYYGNRNILKLAALTLIFPPLLYFLFTKLFNILLPRGIL
jgi:putative tricarboxylic transport membrane protein